MASDSNSRADHLEVILPQQFRDNLSEAERRLLRAAPKGEFAMCGPNFDDNDNDPAKADFPPQSGGWGREREIRGDLIRWLCVDQEASKRVDPRGVRTYGAKITGKLDLSFATVPFPLRLTRCRLTADCDLQDIKTRALSLDSSLTKSVCARGAEVRGDFFLNSGFSAQGEVCLVGAQIGGNLECDRGSFKNPGGRALIAANAEIKGSVFLRGGFSAEGEVFLTGASIGGNLECDRSSFKNPGGRALIAGGAEIKGSVFLRGGFSAEGEVLLSGASIGGNLECDGGSFKNPVGMALTVDGADVKGSVFLRGGFSAEGEVSLSAAHIGVILEALGWRDVQGVTELDLTDSTVGSIWDDETSWPRNGRLHLDGFVYGGISGGATDAPTRLRWLDRQREFTPRPYRQLAKVLREGGDDDGARQVLYELERRRWGGDRRRAMRLWGQLLRGTVGYGIYPGRAVWYLCALTALGWIVYLQAQRVGVMVPTDKDSYAEFRASGHAPAHYQPFNPLIYSVENCLPLVKFGQDDRWQPDPSPRPHVNPRSPATGSRAWFTDLLFVRLLDRATSPVALRWFRWITIASGWLLATFFVAGITGIIRTGL